MIREVIESRISTYPVGSVNPLPRCDDDGAHERKARIQSPRA
jgi:hypothetical protein